MKNLIKTLLFPALILLIFACGSESYTTTRNGIIAKLKPATDSQAKLVRIEVISNEIIRVSATPETSFPQRQSLITVPRETVQTPFTVAENDEFVVISTDKIKTVLSLSSGEIRFTDTRGRTLLREEQGGGKTFSPITVDDTHGYSFRQVFESPDDEAFFGLGQHQSDEWNYKGKNESLYQYNTKVSVPFLVSNKNYGLLWDNYSLTKFGSIEEYEELSQFTLYDYSGIEGGLTASYITAEGVTFIQRSESKIDYENLSSIQNFPADPVVTGISDQYMFGPSLMISPVYDYKWRERSVYFPGSQGWYELLSGEFLSGEQEQTVAAPYEKMPIYVRAGSMIPFGPEIQYTGEKPGEPILLYVYEGADGIFKLYEDEGLNNDYENGAYSTIRFAYNDQAKTLVIGDRKGSFDSMLENRIFRVIYVKKEGPRPLDFEAIPDHVLHYSGKEISIQL